MNTHDFLKEIYFDFCLKNDMPRGKADHRDDLIAGSFLSAEDYLAGNFQINLFLKSRWFKNAYM